MKVFMIGEAANHADKLTAGLSAGWSIVPLPREAAHSGVFDDQIACDDVVISLRYRRDEGQGPVFRLLHIPGAGTDGIDFASLSPQTTVCNVYEHEIPIAEYVLSAMLDWEIRAADMRRRFSPEGWSDAYRSRVPHGEVYAKTLGVVGFGRIGRAIATRARGFGMRIVAVDGHGETNGLANEVLPSDQFRSVLPRADFLVLACPLTPATRGMIGTAELKAMKPDAVLINISRAEIAEEAALFEALSARTIAGAFLDVWYRYPVAADDQVEPSAYPFHTLENAVCTPHCSAWTVQLPHRRYARIADNLERMRRGEALMNVVKSPAPAPANERT